jgi:uncharacterized membrane protein SpoIIM required for sporulation
VDIDRFIVANEPPWQELERLTPSARRGSRLDADGVDRFVQLYQLTSAHLAHVQGTYRDPALSLRLSRLVGSASNALYGTDTGAVRAVVGFFATTFPAAVWGLRRMALIAAVATFLPAIVVGVWIANSDRALEASGPAAVREAYVQEDFEAYYSSAPAAQFATQVLLNNIQVSFLAFALGAALCIGAIWVLAFNGANLGVAAGLFHAVGEAPKFWGLILPHGLLELTAVVIAGAAGIRIGWSVIAPGDRTRAQALADDGRAAVNVLLGLVVVFVVAGLVEGFVTPSALPTAARVAIGIVVQAAFLTYVVVRGTAAEAAHGTAAEAAHGTAAEAASVTAGSPP